MAHNVLGPVHILDTVSMGASIVSDPVEIKYQDNIGIQLEWTGTPVGDIVEYNYFNQSCKKEIPIVSFKGYYSITSNVLNRFF